MENGTNDFLDSPEFRKLISIIEQAAISAENAPFPLSDNKERLLQDTRTAAAESLKTFIREKMKVKNNLSEKIAFLKSSIHAADANVTQNPEIADRIITDLYKQITEIERLNEVISKPQIVFPTEEEIYNVAMNDMDASLDYQTGFVKGANTIIDRIKELNQLGN